MARFFLLPLLFFLAPSLAFAQRCVEDVLCVEVDVQDGAQVVYVVNLRPHDVTVRFDVDLVNMQADVALPTMASYPGRRRTRAFTLRQGNPRSAWRYEYRFTWQLGRLGARHDDRYVYALPYAAGAQFRVGQAYGGTFSHQGRYAIDWVMPEGTAVHAAREGVVMGVRDEFTEGGLDVALKDRANYILIEHPDGTVGSYVHLRPGGLRVRVGQFVARGQLIGYSGNTGYSSGPHLHFEVFRLDNTLQRQTLPVRFEGGANAGLREGGLYRASASR